MQHVPQPDKVDHLMELLKMQHVPQPDKVDHLMEILKMQHVPQPDKVDHLMEILKMQHVPQPTETPKPEHDAPLSTDESEQKPKRDPFFDMLARMFAFFSKDSAAMNSDEKRLAERLARHRQHIFPLMSA